MCDSRSWSLKWRFDFDNKSRRQTDARASVLLFFFFNLLKFQEFLRWLRKILESSKLDSEFTIMIRRCIKKIVILISF